MTLAVSILPEHSTLNQVILYEHFFIVPYNDGARGSTVG
jgi:hypothetical protein